MAMVARQEDEMGLKKVGGLWFVRVGRLQVTLCVVNPERAAARAEARARAEREARWEADRRAQMAAQEAARVWLDAIYHGAREGV